MAAASNRLELVGVSSNPSGLISRQVKRAAPANDNDEGSEFPGYCGNVWVNMNRIGKKFVGFFTAEEIPRWFGLSIVLLYLGGLAATAHFGVTLAREENQHRFTKIARYQVVLLAEQLGGLKGGSLSDPALLASYQRAIRRFTSNVDSRLVRVVKPSGVIVASTDASEIGELSEARTVAVTALDPVSVMRVQVPGLDESEMLVCVRLNPQWPAITTERATQTLGKTTEIADEISGDRPTTLHLEAQLLPTTAQVTSSADRAAVLAVVLAILGCLFVLYRRLREHLRSASQIACRLKSHGGCIQDELESLHIGESTDVVTTAWNSLVDLAKEITNKERRSDADEELSRALARSGSNALADALSVIPDGILYIVDEERLEYVNESSCRLFSWSIETATETALSDAQAGGVGGEILQLIRDSLQPDGSFEARTEIITDDQVDIDRQSCYRVRVIPLQGARRHGECVVLIRDVSQQIRADRAREEFITQVTHELRTPLTNIRAYAETLSSGMLDDPNVVTECYNVITKETRRLSRLIEDILNVSQLEVGTIELHIDDVDAVALLTQAVQDVRGLADEKKIDIQLALPPKSEPIQGDRDKLAVVINNLLGNAIKYTQEGGSIVVGCQMGGGEVIVTVKDNGIGIDPRDHDRIFDKFQRADDERVQQESGTGIGLYTAREIVRRHKGNIEVMSSKGEGSTFLVRLPQEQGRAARLSTNAGV